MTKTMTNTKTTIIKRVLVAIVALMTAFTVWNATQIDAQAATWKTGCFDTGYTAKGYTTVRLSKNKKGKLQSGKIKIYTYNSLTGWKTSGKIHVTLRDTNGRWICEFDTTSGATLKLGNDHAAYRVYIAKKKMKNSADDFINVGNCGYWAIQCTSNTYI